MMDRLEGRVGLRVHAHGFRHTFATVATQMGWNLERVRDVCLSAERDLGPKTAWAEYIACTKRRLREDQNGARLTPQRVDHRVNGSERGVASVLSMSLSVARSSAQRQRVVGTSCSR